MSDILILLPTINSAWDSAMKKHLPSSSFYPFFLEGGINFTSHNQAWLLQDLLNQEIT